MKKFITIFLILISFFITFIYYKQSSSNELEKILNIEQQGNSVKLVIPEDIRKLDQQTVFNVFDKLLKKYNGNLVLSKIDSTNKVYRKYIYCTNNNYFKEIKVDSGRNLNIKDNNTDNFLSTKNTNKNNQVGTISYFGGNNNLEIHTLRSYIKKRGSFEGIFVANFKNGVNKNDFVNELQHNLNITITTMDMYPYSADNIPLYPIIIILYIVVSVLIFYSILNSYKEIAIEKLNGYSNKQVWISRIRNILSMQFCEFLLVSLSTSIILFRKFNAYFFKITLSLLLLNVIFLLVSFILFSIPFIYVKKIKIVDMLKNKNSVNAIVLLNNCIKIVLTIILLIMSINSISNYKEIKAFYNDSLSQWEITKNYMIIPNLYALPQDLVNSDKMIEINENLYKYFNHRGSILADFTAVSPQYLKANSLNEDNVNNAIKLNPNYINENPIYDINGNRIKISEGNINFILLVPQKYKTEEKNIINYYKTVKESLPDVNGRVSFKDQKIDIIWIKNDQQIFSYRLDINSKNGNRVKNPIIRVITESNGSNIDYDTVLGVSGNPFKIKIKNTQDVSNYIRPKLKELGINQYVPTITSVYDSISYEVNYTKILTEIYIISTLITLLGILVVTVQNIFNYFEQYKKRLAIESFNGYKMKDKYFNYFKNILIIWALIIIATTVLSNFKIINLLIAVIPMLIIEFSISIITIKLAEKRNLIRIVKGG